MYFFPEEEYHIFSLLIRWETISPNKIQIRPEIFFISLSNLVGLQTALLKVCMQTKKQSSNYIEGSVTEKKKTLNLTDGVIKNTVFFVSPRSEGIFDANSTQMLKRIFRFYYSENFVKLGKRCFLQSFFAIPVPEHGFMNTSKGLYPWFRHYLSMSNVPFSGKV